MTAMVGVTGIVVISRIIGQNMFLQYFGRISLVILCTHGPIYRGVVKVLSMPMHMSTDAVRENAAFVAIAVMITLVACSVVNEIVTRWLPWMIGKKKLQFR